MPFVVSKAILLSSVGLVFHKYLEQHELIVYEDVSFKSSRSISICNNGNDETYIFDLPYHHLGQTEPTATCDAILPYIHCLSHVKIDAQTFNINSGVLESSSCNDESCLQCVNNITLSNGNSLFNLNLLGLDRSWFLGFVDSSDLLPVIGAHSAAIFQDQYRLVDSFQIPPGRSISMNNNFIKHGIHHSVNHSPYDSSYSEAVDAMLPCFNIANMLVREDMVPYYIETGFNAENHKLGHAIDKCGLRDSIHRVGTRKLFLNQWNQIKKPLADRYHTNLHGSICSVVDTYYAIDNSDSQGLEGGSIICLEGFLANLAKIKDSYASTLVYLSDFETNSIAEDGDLVEQMNILQAISSFAHGAHQHGFVKLSVISIYTQYTHVQNDMIIHDMNRILKLVYSILHNQADASMIKEHQDQIVTLLEETLFSEIPSEELSSSAIVYLLGLSMSRILLQTFNEPINRNSKQQREKIWLVMDPIVKKLFSGIPLSIQSRQESFLTELTADLLEGSLNPITFEYKSKVADFLTYQSTLLSAINTHDHRTHILIFIHSSELDTARNIGQVWKEKCIHLACHFYVKPIIIQLPYESEFHRINPYRNNPTSICSVESEVPSVRFALQMARHHIRLILQDAEVAVILIGMQSVLSFISQGSDLHRGVIPSVEFMGKGFYGHSHPLISSIHFESGLAIAGLAGSLCQLIDQVLLHPVYPIASDSQLISMVQQYLATYRFFVKFDKEMNYFDSEKIANFCHRLRLSVAVNGDHNNLINLDFERSRNASYKTFGFVYWPPIIHTLSGEPERKTINATLLNEKTSYALIAVKQHCSVLLTTYLALSLYDELSHFRSEHLSNIDPSISWSWSWPFSVGILNSVSIFLHLCPTSHSTLDETLETLELLIHYEKQLSAPPILAKPQHVDYQMINLLLSSLHFEIGSLNLALDHYYLTIPLLVYSEVQDAVEEWRETKHRIQSFSSLPSRKNIVTHYVTYATASTPALDSLIQSGIVAGINITVLGIGNEFTSYFEKWDDGYAPYLLQQPDDDFAVLMDAYDSIVFPSLKNISNVLLSSPAPIMFCSEFESYPDNSAPYLYPSVMNRHQPPRENTPKFLNSGCIAGRIGSLKKMWHLISPHMTVLRDDQQALAKFYLTYPHMATLDSGSIMTTGYRKNCSDDACSAISVTRALTNEGTEELVFTWGDVSGIGLGHFNQKGRSKAFNRTAAAVNEFYQSQIQKKII